MYNLNMLHISNISISQKYLNLLLHITTLNFAKFVLRFKTLIILEISWAVAKLSHKVKERDLYFNEGSLPDQVGSAGHDFALLSQVCSLLISR